MKICNKCGFQFDDGNFCPNCGNKIIYQESVSFVPNYNYIQNDQNFNVQQPLPKRGMGIASMILGVCSILSLITCYTYGVVPQFIFGVISLIFAIISKSSAAKVNRSNGFAKAGLILSIVSLSIFLLLVTIGFIVIFFIMLEESGAFYY